MYSDFKLLVWAVVIFRRMKIDKVHQSSGFIWSVLLYLLILLHWSAEKLFPVKEFCYFFDYLTVMLNIILWLWHSSVNKSHLYILINTEESNKEIASSWCELHLQRTCQGKVPASVTANALFYSKGWTTQFLFLKAE